MKNKFQKGNTVWLGRKHSAETRKKMSERNKGKRFGPPHSIESRKKMSDARKGANHYNWKGGVTGPNQALRKTFEYRLWREAVFVRDKYTCIWCGATGVYLHADHIKAFASHPELRFATDNGRTLCVPCHRTTDTWGRNKKYDETI